MANRQMNVPGRGAGSVLAQVSEEKFPVGAAKPATSAKPMMPAPDQKEKIERLAAEFESSRKLLLALGDESRMHIVLTMMRMGDCSGVRALEVAERTSLSRPAVSHHLQILKDAGILKTRKEGTKIFYYFDPDMRSVSTLIDALRLSVEITQSLPDRS